MALPSDIPTPENLERSRQQVEEEQRRKAQRDSQLSALDKALGAYEAARTIGSALYQKAASFPTFLSQGQEAADKQVAERMFIPKTEPGIDYLQGMGDFLTKVETEYKIPPVIPEVAPFQYPAGIAAAQGARLAGKAAGATAKATGRAIDQAMVEGTGPLRRLIPEAVRPMNVVKPEGGQWFKDSIFDKAPDQSARIKSIEQDLKDPNLSAQNKEILQRQYSYLKNTDALKRWEKGNLANYVKNKMATPEDPVRALAERGVTHLPQDPDWNEYVHIPASVRKKREEAGFDEEGMGKSPQARLWEVMSDEATIPARAGDYQEALKAKDRLDKMQPELAAAVERVNRNFDQVLRSSGIPLSEVHNRNVHTHIADKAKKIGDEGFQKLWNEQDQLNKLVSGSIGYIAQQNPWLSKLDPNDPVYRAKIRNLGFDHVLDVLREDLNSGRIRPEQLNKISVEDAIKRTHEYDQEMAKKMRETTAAVREGLPVYKQYPEGYRWIELNKPGSFAHESDMMGHSVRGYEPPKGHEDWVEASKDYGSEDYGHGGWDAIKSGRAKVYSLVDEKGDPHVTVEVKSGTAHSSPEESKAIQDQAAAEANTKNVKTGEEWDNFYFSRVKELQMKKLAEKSKDLPSEVTQIKGKGNLAPKETYLPFVQDFVRSGKWSQINDTRNAGLRRYGDVFNVNEQRKIESLGGNVPDHEWLTGEEIQQLHNLITPEGGRLKYDSKGNIIGGEGKSGYKQGGKVHISNNLDTMRIELAEGKKMQVGGIAKAAAKRAAKAAKAIEPLPASESAENLKKFLEGSKVKDRLYHGTADDFSEFRFNPDKSLGIWAAKQPELAGEYSGIVSRGGKNPSVMPLHMVLKNPANQAALDRATQQAENEVGRNWGTINRRRREILQSQGYDGIDLGDTYVAFDPQQIKSAIGNRGTYDINDPDITKARGGPVRMAKGGNPALKALSYAFESQKADGGAVKMAGGGSFAKSLAKLARAQAKSRQEIDAIAERIAPQVTGEYVRESDKSARTVAGKTQKQFEREKTLPVDIREDVPAKEVSPVDIEALKGNVMIGIPGDPTVTGKTLHSVGGVNLESPSPQHGGPLYGLYGDPEHFWASGLGAASRVQNLATEASKQYDAPVVGKYVMMGPESINYAQHFADANLQAIDISKMTADQVKGFNELIRKGSPKSGPRPSFPGIEDKGSAYLHFSVDPELRKYFNQLMQQPTISKQFNLPSGQDIRMAITEPSLRDLETGVTGFSMGRMKPEIKGRELKLSPHPTYSHDIPGEFIGGMKYPVPYELSFPDTLKAIRENPKQAPQEFGSLKMVGPRQTIDQQLIDEIKMYEEKMKRLTGKKKGGAVKKGKVKISNSRDAHFLASLD